MRTVRKFHESGMTGLALFGLAAGALPGALAVRGRLAVHQRVTEDEVVRSGHNAGGALHSRATAPEAPI